jgi:alkanesulfonate monooxygenase SsuD/methylene tetrahydromethanopterin reductase-like flavin-dependent oxidoreductase (luciferase family)
MEHYMDDGGADGFMLIATYTPGCFEEFTDLVVPELQRRGRFRSRYEGSTLRDHLLEN